MKKLFILAALSAIFATPAVAGDIGGGIALGNMSSFAGGATGAGQIGGSGVLGNGVLSGSLTQSAHSDQLAGTTSNLTKLPNGMQAQIVSEYQGNSWTNMTSNVIGAGSVGMVSINSGLAGGLGFSTGNQVFATGYLNW